VKILAYESPFPFSLPGYDGKTREITCCEDLNEYFAREMNINPLDFPFGKETKILL